MRKLLSKLTFALVVALVMGLGLVLPAMADNGPENENGPVELPMNNVLRKTLTMPEGATVLPPGLQFQFNFARPDGATPAGLTILNQTLTIPAAPDAPEAYLNLGTILDGLVNTPGLNAGFQDWIVTEVIPLVGDRVPGMTYDGSQFRLRVHFANNMDANGVLLPPPAPPLVVIAVEVFRTHDRQGNPLVDAGGEPIGYPGQKYEDGLAFFNTFVPPVGPDPHPALVVSKTVGAYRAYANLNTDFPFTVTLTPPPALGGVTPALPSPLVGTIQPGGTSVPFTIDAAGVATASFNLRHDQRLEIPTLPAGTQFTVLETGVANFAPTARVTQGGVQGAMVQPAPPPGVGQNLTVTGTIHNANANPETPPHGNRADFTNNYHRQTPTGLVIANMPFFIAGAAALLLALMLTSRRRKRIEDMPVAY